MIEHKETKAYKVIYKLVKAVFPKYRTYGAENLPDEPCLMIANHSQMNGPIACELYTPGQHWIWCAGQMMEKSEVAEYAYQDFWSFKPKWQAPIWRLAAKAIVPLAVCIFNGAHCIPVYHDHRLYGTFRETVEKVAAGNSVVIFPEQNIKHNNILYDFQEGFVDTALFIYKKTKQKIAFVPEYICPERRTLYYGKPVYFNPDAPLKEERARIKQIMMDEITRMAVSLPEHTVVPYRNIRKKDYPKNKPLVNYETEN